MLEELRQKSKHSMFLKLIICVVIVTVCMAITKVSFITYLQGPLELGTMTEWDTEELEGKYVTYEVDTILTSFAEETSTNTKTNITTVTGMCYICEYYDEDSQTYMLYAIKGNKSNIDELDAITFSDTATKTYRVTGTFEKMSGELLQYYDEAIEEGGGAELLDYAIPYIINDKTIGGLDYSMAIILNAVAFLSLVAAVITVVNFTRGHHDRYLKKYLKLNLRETMTGIESDYVSANVLNKNYRIGRKYLFYARGGTMSIVPLEEQIWAYYYRRNGRNSVSQIRFYNLERKATYVNISKPLAEKLLSYLNLSFQHMVIGYDADLQKMYTKNFNEFLNLRYNEAKVAAATQDAFYAEKDSTME